MKNALKHGFIDGFVLKIFALLFMTFDHVGLLLRTVNPYKQGIIELSNVFRSIGRLALPLFVFMIVVGVIHTRSFKKYVARLGVMAIFISIVLLIINYVDFGFDTRSISGAGNIFLDLTLCAVAVYTLRHPKKWVKLLTLLPLAISIISFVVKCYEFSTNATVVWYPVWLYLQYDWFSIVLAILFYFSYYAANLYKKYVAYKDGIVEETWEDDYHQDLLVKILQVVSLVIASFALYSFKYLWSKGVYWDADTQLFAIISGAFILFYNGKRGYNAKWFQYGSYLYYPLHLAVIILIYIIVNGGF